MLEVMRMKFFFELPHDETNLMYAVAMFHILFNFNDTQLQSIKDTKQV